MKWLTPSSFPPNAAGNQTSELAVVQLSVEGHELGASQTAFEERWNNALSDAYFEWLTKQHTACPSGCALASSLSAPSSALGHRLLRSVRSV